MMKKKADKYGCFTLPMRNCHSYSILLTSVLKSLMFYIAYEELSHQVQCFIVHYVHYLVLHCL